MAATWLVLDANYLCHRAFYACGHLTHNDVLTGVVYAFLRDIPVFAERHAAQNFVFCFDHGRGARTELSPGYKASRDERYAAMTDEEKETRTRFLQEVSRLRDKYLTKIGYRNVFSQPGYEADDIIASVVQESLPPGDDAIIISADADLLQLLSPNVRMYNPTTHRMYTSAAFHKEWGIDPLMWSHVKAWSGCTTDDVVGVRGVGEKTAAKWVKGQIAPGSAAYAKFVDNLETFNRNIKLVSLPFAGTGTFTLRPDQVTETKWAEFTRAMGMKSIADKPPRGIKHDQKRSEGFGLRRTYPT